MNTEVQSILEIEELEAKIAPQSAAGFLDSHISVFQSEYAVLD